MPYAIDGTDFAPFGKQPHDLWMLKMGPLHPGGPG